MSTPSTTEHAHGARRLLLVVFAVGLALIAIWPYLATAGHWPMTPDTPYWVARSDPASDGWADWVFRRRHFTVGFRPVTGLTFAAGTWLFGPHPWVLHTTDLALHLGAALALMLLARRLAPDLPRWAPLLAGALFLAHPVIEEVAPISARRGYSLACLLGAAGLAVSCGAARGGGGTARRLRRSFPAGALLALALLSNELGVLAVAALPLLVLACEPSGPGRFGRVVAAGVGPTLAVGAALLARQSVVGGMGGYILDASAQAPFGEMLSMGWRRLAAVGVGRRGGPFAGSTAFWTWVASAAAVHLAATAAVVRAEGGRADGSRGHAGRCAALALWVAAYPLLFAALGVLYPRQVHAAVGPFAILCAVQFAATARLSRGVLRSGLLAGQVAVLAGVLSASPLVRGPDAQRIEKWSARQGLTTAMVEVARSVRGPALVRWVLPTTERPKKNGPRRMHATTRGGRLGRDARTPARWVNYLLDRRARTGAPQDAVQGEEFFYVVEETWDWRAAPTLVGSGRDLAVAIPPGFDLRPAQGRLKRAGAPQPGEPDVILLGHLPDAAGRAVYVFLYRERGGELVPAS